jgi:hypothetical protein
LTWLRARWLSEAQGRFFQPDSFGGDPQRPVTLNAYAYVVDDPVRFTDPTGHYECQNADCTGIAFEPGGYAYHNPATSRLYQLISLFERGNASASARIDQVLDNTAGANQKNMPLRDRLAGRAARINFGGLGQVAGDSGFVSECQDDHWYHSDWTPGALGPQSQQLGHFLTAINMSRAGSRVFLSLMLAHEQSSDRKGMGPVAGRVAAILRSGTDIDAFMAAVLLDSAGDPSGRDTALHTILDPYGPLSERVGNSMEDLRLDVRAYRLVQLVASGQLRTNRDVANWIALNVAAAP